MKDRTAAIMTTVSFIGVVWLLWFASRVAEHASHRDRPTFVVDTRLATVYIPRSLIEFAKTHKPCRDHEELNKAVRDAGLRDSWLAMTSVVRMSDGRSQKHHVIFRPGDPDQSHAFLHIQELLEVVSGANPTSTDMARIKIIDDRRLGDDPADVVADMEESGR